MLGIIVVAFNQPDFILRQNAHLKRFCKDPYQLIIIDNSTSKEAADCIKHHCGELGLIYVKVNAATTDPSQSHAFAANFAYHRFRDQYDILFFTDHDSFAIKDFSPSEILNSSVAAGLPQVRNGIYYYWPGSFMVKTFADVDFSVMPGFDTGAGTHKLIDSYSNYNACKFFDEAYVQNMGFTKPPYNFYSLLADGTFMHFLNGSNWANSAENEDRINSLFNILDGYLKSE